jgi:hypothetical protein
MTRKQLILYAIGAASLALPGAASAQEYYGQSYGQPYYGQPHYEQPHGDWYGRRYGFRGYPEFQGIENHIRREIEESARDDMIERDDAQDLMDQLRQIQMQEAREFSFHGWNLPDDDRARIHAQLDRLDHVVDETRDEQ